MKRLKRTLSAALLLLLATPPAFAYYCPSTGTWPNRDPLRRTSGENLYATSDNDLEDNFDLFGGEPNISGTKIALRLHSPVFFEARSYVKCVAGPDAGKIYGVVFWGYTYNYDSTPVGIGPYF